MTSQPTEYPTDSVDNLESELQSSVTPAVKTLAAAYLIYYFGVKSEHDGYVSAEQSQEALNTILEWLRRLYVLSHLLFKLPHFDRIAETNLSAFDATLEKLRKDVTEFKVLTPPNSVEKPFTKNNTIDPDIAASQLLLRMQWSLDWVKQHRQYSPPETALHKTWISRMDESTCTVACKRLHGTKVLVGDSFTPSALDKGVPKSLIYGALWGPPIHPHCRCRLLFT